MPEQKVPVRLSSTCRNGAGPVRPVMRFYYTALLENDESQWSRPRKAGDAALIVLKDTDHWSRNGAGPVRPVMPTLYETMICLSNSACFSTPRAKHALYVLQEIWSLCGGTVSFCFSVASEVFYPSNAGPIPYRGT